MKLLLLFLSVIAVSWSMLLFFGFLLWNAKRAYQSFSICLINFCAAKKIFLRVLLPAFWGKSFSTTKS